MSSPRRSGSSSSRATCCAGSLILDHCVMSIIVACFQAFYHSRGTTAKANLTFEAPGPFLAAVAGIAESSIWRHLDDRELGWFLKKVPYGPDESRWIRDEGAGLTKKRPTRFLFRSTSPTDPRGCSGAVCLPRRPGHPIKTRWRCLTELVRGQYRVEPRDIFPFPPPPPPRDWLDSGPGRLPDSQCDLLSDRD